MRSVESMSIAKNRFPVRFIAFVMLAALLLMVRAANAQEKVGYINTSELLDAIPETAGVDSQLQAYGQNLQDSLQEMQLELEDKIAEYRETSSLLTATDRESKEKELQSLNEQIQEYQNSSQQDYQKKSQELMAPILEKAQRAVREVADEHDYTYIIDQSSQVLLYFPEQDNILPMVKKKLNLE